MNGPRVIPAIYCSLILKSRNQYDFVTKHYNNDSAVCDDSPAETTTTDLSQLTTVLQRDIEGKSYLFSHCPPVLKVYRFPYLVCLKTRAS